jgi:hypothetical protein
MPLFDDAELVIVVAVFFGVTISERAAAEESRAFPATNAAIRLD